MEEVKIKIDLLRAIADYYQFPFAVFFAPIDYFQGTRGEKYMEAYEKLDEIIEHIEKIETIIRRKK